MVNCQNEKTSVSYVISSSRLVGREKEPWYLFHSLFLLVENWSWCSRDTFLTLRWWLGGLESGSVVIHYVHSLGMLEFHNQPSSIFYFFVCLCNEWIISGHECEFTFSCYESFMGSAGIPINDAMIFTMSRYSNSMKLTPVQTYLYIYPNLFNSITFLLQPSLSPLSSIFVRLFSPPLSSPNYFFPLP